MASYVDTPTEAEFNLLANLLGADWGYNREEVEDLLKRLLEPGKVLVSRNYISDGPGFIGDIFFILFGNGPGGHKVIGHYKGPYNSWQIYKVKRND